MMDFKTELSQYLIEHLKVSYNKMTAGRGRIVGGIFSDYNYECASFEFFSRNLYGLFPLILIYKENKYPEIDSYISKFNYSVIEGTNPNSDFYWGKYVGPDQYEVELIPICLMLIFARNRTWNTYSDIQKKHISEWLNLVNTGTIYDSNWLFFRIIVNASLRKLDMPYCKKSLNKAIEHLNRLYLGNGWYQDGYQKRIDYYNVYSFHFYGLLYSKIDENSQISKIFIERADLFASNLLYFHSSDGDMIPWGRSLTYKMAECCFWSMEVFVNHYSFSKGIVKGILRRFFDFWKTKPIYDEAGLITLGYGYNNPFITENYTTFGSSYWAYKFFIFLGTNDIEFWNIKEEPLPFLKRKTYFKESGFVVCSNKDRRVVTLFPNIDSGSTDIVLNFSAKYMKFVYSNSFAFSVPRSNDNFSRFGADNTLAASYDDIHFSTRTELLDYKSNEKYIYSKYLLLKEVSIQTYIIPNSPWHIRVHLIDTKEKVFLYDSGFSIDNKNSVFFDNENIVRLKNDKFITAVITFTKNEKIQKITQVSNAHLLYPVASFLTAKSCLEPGHYVLVNAFMGDTVDSSETEDFPEIIFTDNIITIKIKEYCLSIDTKGYYVPSINYFRHLGKNILRKLKKYLNSLQLRGI